MLNEEEARDSIIVALDCPKDEALSLAAKLSGRANWVKVGMTLFYAEGPSIVEQMRQRGLKVFLDLKFHDIPFQVKGAARSAALAGADLLSVHSLGSSEMIRQARAGVEEAAKESGRPRARLVAITVLTSMDEASLEEVGIPGGVSQEVDRLARMACGAGADGVVCSPKEATQMRAILGEDALIVTPGVRPAGSDLADQKRVATPSRALAAGASKLVIGRPITQAPDPAAAFDSICTKICHS